MSWILSRLKEPSTYAGLATIGALLGLHWSPDQYQAVFAAIIAIVNAWQMVRSEPVAK